MLSRSSQCRLSAAMLIFLCFIMLMLHNSSILAADPGEAVLSPNSLDMQDNEETRDLLQKTLSVSEIDREILRISADQSSLEKKVSILNKQAIEKKSVIADQEERAGAIIRSYYVGDRDGLLTAFLSAKSLSKLFLLFDYYELTIGRDHEILNQYEKQYKDLKATIQSAERNARELSELRSNLEEQKIRVAALNKEIENGLEESSDPQKMSALLDEFTKYWENIGLHEVNTYFKALSAAMNHLPQFVQNQDGMLERQGMTYHLKLKEEDLNVFLHSQNKLLENFSFHFDDNAVTAVGNSGNLSLQLKGHYTIQEKPENSLMFHIDDVVFNGLKLPDTTRKSLEEEFDLGFYPGNVISFLHATAVDCKKGVLHVTLTLEF